MCIKNVKETKRKSIIAYKVAAKYKGKYYTFITGNRVKLGKPSMPPLKTLHRKYPDIDHIKKWSAFTNLRDAKWALLLADWNYSTQALFGKIVILKIKMSGSIVTGYQNEICMALKACLAENIDEIYGEV